MPTDDSQRVTPAAAAASGTAPISCGRIGPPAVGPHRAARACDPAPGAPALPGYRPRSLTAPAPSPLPRRPAAGCRCPADRRDPGRRSGCRRVVGAQRAVNPTRLARRRPPQALHAPLRVPGASDPVPSDPQPATASPRPTARRAVSVRRRRLAGRRATVNRGAARRVLVDVGVRSGAGRSSLRRTISG